MSNYPAHGEQSQHLGRGVPRPLETKLTKGLDAAGYLEPLPSEAYAEAEREWEEETTHNERVGCAVGSDAGQMGGSGAAGHSILRRQDEGWRGEERRTAESAENNKQAGDLEARLVGVLRRKHYSYNTEQCYVMWYRQFVKWHGGNRHPETMGAQEISAFLTHLAVNKGLAATSQNQALNAIIFLYKQVLEMPVEGIEAQRAKHHRRLPVVLTQEQVKALLAGVTGEVGMVCRLLYGCGLRVAEALNLRIKDVHIEGRKLEVRAGKGDKDCLSRLLRLLRPSGFASLRLSRA